VTFYSKFLNLNHYFNLNRSDLKFQVNSEEIYCNSLIHGYLWMTMKPNGVTLSD